MSRKRTRRARAEHSSTAAPPLRGAWQPSRRRLWLFRVGLIALPWLLLGTVELGLRAVGYGAAMDFAIRRKVGGETRLLSNPRFTWLFFDPNMARLVPPFSLAAQKPKGTCRVFLLGSSAAQGDPEPGFGVARVLEVLLAEQFPGVEFEVVNAATAAINSHVVYQMARAAVALDPDLFVVYMGNNEVIGPYGAGSTSTAGARSLPLLRAGLALKSTRLGQLLDATVRGAARLVGRGPATVEWRGMETFADRQVRLSAPALEHTYACYERNLTDICRVAARSGVPVVLSTLAVNLRSCAPFGSLHPTDLTPEQRTRWEALYRAGAQAADAQRWSDAAAILQQAARIDDGYAELAYRLAQCEWGLGRFDDAGRLYQRALDLDTLRFRADARINEIVRRVAEREAARGVRFVDGRQALATVSPHGVTGEELLLDHVHFTFTGNYQLAIALLGPVREALPAWVRTTDSGRRALSEEECARRLVYTELDRYMIAETMFKRRQQAPFTAQLDHRARLARLSLEMAALKTRGEKGGIDAAVREYELALAAPRPHWSIRERHATIQRRLGNIAAAAREWRLLVDQFPQYPAYRLQLARALRETGAYADADAVLRAVTDDQPESSLTLTERAKAALLAGQAREALQHARRAVALDAKDPDALHVLAACLCRREACSTAERAEAIDHLGHALALAPESASVRRDLARLLLRQAQEFQGSDGDGRTIALLDKVLEAQSDLIDAHEALGLLCARRGERDRALRHLRAALAADPSRTRAREVLVTLEQR
jgi:tetratricopeptide (TPR) repeat protein